MKKFITAILSAMVLIALLGCMTDSKIASQNLSKAAEMFQINRRIVFYNSILDVYMLSIEGRCAIKSDRADNQLEVTCKTSEQAYKKHFLGISDNVTYFVEQLSSVEVGVYHYKVIFKPESIIPDVDLVTSD